MMTKGGEVKKTKMDKGGQEAPPAVVAAAGAADILAHAGDVCALPFSGEALALMTQPTPSEFVKAGAEDSGLDGVSGAYIKALANRVFGWRIDFTVKDKGEVTNRQGAPWEVWVLGRLAVRNERNIEYAAREQFGRGRVDGSLADAFKSAATDCFKKCAADLGICADIYGRDAVAEAAPPEKESADGGVDYRAKFFAALAEAAGIEYTGEVTKAQAKAMVAAYNAATGNKMRTLTGMGQATAKRRLFAFTTANGNKVG